jgi:hypothetical protein
MPSLPMLIPASRHVDLLITDYWLEIPSAPPKARKVRFYSLSALDQPPVPMISSIPVIWPSKIPLFRPHLDVELQSSWSSSLFLRTE